MNTFLMVFVLISLTIPLGLAEKCDYKGVIY